MIACHICPNVMIKNHELVAHVQSKKHKHNAKIASQGETWACDVCNILLLARNKERHLLNEQHIKLSAHEPCDVCCRHSTDWKTCGTCSKEVCKGCAFRVDKCPFCRTRYPADLVGLEQMLRTVAAFCAKNGDTPAEMMSELLGVCNELLENDDVDVDEVMVLIKCCHNLVKNPPQIRLTILRRSVQIGSVNGTNAEGQPTIQN
jgi:hypothetical protein